MAVPEKTGGMLRAGNLLMNVRQLAWVELRAKEVRARVANATMVRRFSTDDEAKSFFNEFQAEVARASRTLEEGAL